MNDKELEKLITDFVHENELFISGHYHVNDIICSRDWINTTELLSDKVLFDKVIKAFSYELYSKMENNYNQNIVFLGIGFAGLTIGTILAHKFNSPFIHIVPYHFEKYYDCHEIERLSLSSNVCYVIVTDVVITGNTVRKLIEKYELNFKNILGIYTVFHRGCNKDHIDIDESVISKIYAINSNFDAELRKKNKCKLYNEYGKCICNNKFII